MVEDIIGRKFRRNKYGLSVWKDEIEKVHFSLKLVKWPSKFDKRDYKEAIKENAREFGYIPEITVQAKDSKLWFNINEIIVF